MATKEELQAVIAAEVAPLKQEIADIKTYLGSKDPTQVGTAVGRGSILSDVDWKVEEARRGGFSHKTGKPDPAPEPVTN